MSQEPGGDKAPHYYPPNFRMQGHHFNNLANKRNRVPEETNNSGMLPAPTVVGYQGPS
jgi:hypothetical protein